MRGEMKRSEGLTIKILPNHKDRSDKKAQKAQTPQNEVKKYSRIHSAIYAKVVK
jgi:hypothetical protein